MNITRSGECGNSPKNAFVEEFVIALLRGDDLSGRLAEDAQRPVVEVGKISALIITHAISHGRVGACNGVIKTGASDIPFAIMLEFANTKGDRVRRIDLYRSS